MQPGRPRRVRSITNDDAEIKMSLCRVNKADPPVPTDLRSRYPVVLVKARLRLSTRVKTMNFPFHKASKRTNERESIYVYIYILIIDNNNKNSIGKVFSECMHVLTKKTFIDFNAMLPAFFRMKLHGKDISASDGASKRAWIENGRSSDGGIARLWEVAVREVKARLVRDTFP